MISFLKNVKLAQREYAFKDYASSILSELEWFKLVTTLALVFKKLKVKIKLSMTIFIQA